ncbi:hypothetical protein M8J76_011461 [Diaphorina citri]|nr:hypothetical protein M8J76_008249 [Diaphorina citri]KAI5716215.1 hypothetical protein M8J76_002930 [Diaphorina citri]KAI5719106.1 hypothetical protein M8J76_005219 [Diaphorina citri]KAI5741209.1 hypothetical protein M8J76_011461 [Diaphorina citri]
MVATTACCSLDCSCSDILSPPTASTVTAATLSQGPGSSALLAGRFVVLQCVASNPFRPSSHSPGTNRKNAHRRKHTRHH